MIKGYHKNICYFQVGCEIRNHFQKYISHFKEVIKVQNICSEALRLWGYKEVQTQMDLPEFNFVQDFVTFF